MGHGPEALLRTHSPGHFTGSALVTDSRMEQVLLTHHAKLGLWLQLGGHADGDMDLASVALREAEEESGLGNVALFPLGEVFDLSAEGLIFDLDIHPIPARGAEPAHYHYDVRYLLIGNPQEPLKITPESKDLKWVPLSDAYGLSSEWSMHRQFDKLSWLRKQWASA
ncbi:NUDIX hydrolase [bacterium]|nr:NUDIX hydrolase [bacterium]